MRLSMVLCMAFLMSALAAGQTPAMRGYIGYGYGPYVPMATTPMISLQSVSPDSVGASNATYGLVAGATNSTLSIINGNTSSTYTVPVWYSGGGAPMISSPEVSLRPHFIRSEEIRMEARKPRVEQAAAGVTGAWTYFASVAETGSAVEAAASAKTAKRATRTITNQDIDQENQKTGMVKYDGKTEKIQ